MSYEFLKENGNKVLIENFKVNKNGGKIIFLGFLVFGILLIAIDLERTDFSSVLSKNLWGIFLICLSSLPLLITIPLKMKITEYQEEFLIKKVYQFWIKKEFKINKKDNPVILGVKHSRFQPFRGQDILIITDDRLYELKFSYKGKEIPISYPMIITGLTWNNPKEIKKIADFFNLPYKLVDKKGNLLK